MVMVVDAEVGVVEVKLRSAAAVDSSASGGARLPAILSYRFSVNLGRSAGLLSVVVVVAFAV